MQWLALYKNIPSNHWHWCSVTWHFSSGRENAEISPRFEMKRRQFSEMLEFWKYESVEFRLYPAQHLWPTARLVKEDTWALRTTTPSLAVTLYFPHAAKPGRENSFNWTKYITHLPFKQYTLKLVDVDMETI